MQHRIARGRTTSRKLKIETAVRQISVTAYETPNEELDLEFHIKGIRMLYCTFQDWK